MGNGQNITNEILEKRARSAMFGLLRAPGNLITPARNIQLYTFLVEPIATYGAEIWFPMHRPRMCQKKSFIEAMYGERAPWHASDHLKYTFIRKLMKARIGTMKQPHLQNWVHTPRDSKWHT